MVQPGPVAERARGSSTWSPAFPRTAAASMVRGAARRSPAPDGRCTGTPAGTSATAVQSEPPARLVREPQMAVVDGIEGAAQDAEDARRARRVSLRGGSRRAAGS